MCDRDADLDYVTLKRILATPAVKTLRICKLYFLLGWTAKRVAEEMHMTEGAVRQVIRRARLKLSHHGNGTLPYRFDPFPQNQC